MKKYMSNENGLTLVEVLVTLVIMSIVSGVIYSVFATGLKLYQKIGIEAQLRDDADYAATLILNEMYNYPPNYITKYEEDGAAGIELTRYSEKNVDGYVVEDSTEIERKTLVYFKNNQFYIYVKTLTEDGGLEETTTEITSETSSFTTHDEESSTITYKCTTSESANKCEHGTISLNIVIGRDSENLSNFLKTEPLILKSSFGF